jgi:hypothetical protein
MAARLLLTLAAWPLIPCTARLHARITFQPSIFLFLTLPVESGTLVAESA